MVQGDRLRRPAAAAGRLRGDLGHNALGEEWELRTAREPVQVPNLPMNLIRTYEDHVLGKMYADWTFGRGSDALRRYAKGREQAAAWRTSSASSASGPLRRPGDQHGRASTP